MEDEGEYKSDEEECPLEPAPKKVAAKAAAKKKPASKAKPKAAAKAKTKAAAKKAAAKAEATPKAVLKKPAGRSKPAADEESKPKRGKHGSCGTFARRYEPEVPSQANRFNAIKSVFMEHLSSKLEKQSAFQDHRAIE